MLKLRLQRRGKKNHATYRVVVAEQRAPVKGKFVADVGFYNPHTKELKVDKDAVSEWIKKGAQPSSTVHNLLVESKVIKGDKVTSWTPKKKEAEESPEEKPEEENLEEKPAEEPSIDEEPEK